jgi:hypothetical protein
VLVDFFSTQQLVEAVQRVCEQPASMQAMREQARRTVVERYDLNTICLPEQRRLIESWAS